MRARTSSGHGERRRTWDDIYDDGFKRETGGVGRGAHRGSRGELEEAWGAVTVTNPSMVSRRLEVVDDVDPCVVAVSGSIWYPERTKTTTSDLLDVLPCTRDVDGRGIDGDALATALG